MTAPLLETTAVAKAFGPVVALRAVDLQRPPRRGPRPARRQRRRQVDARQDPHRRAARRRRDDRHPRRADRAAPPERRPRRRSGARVPGPGAGARPHRRREPAPDRAPTSAPCGPSSPAMDLDGLDLDEQVRDVPLPFLRMLDLARALAFDPQLLLLDEITAALPPDLSERVFAVMRRWKERNRSVLFISHRLAEVRAHCDMCTVLRDGRDVASFVPGEGGEAQIVSAMLGEAATVVRDEARRARRPRVADRRPPGPRGRGHRRRPPARRRLAGRGARRGARPRRPRGPGPGDAVRRARRQPQRRPRPAADRRRSRSRPRHPFDVIRRGVVLVPADRLHALLPQRSIRENIAAPLFNRVARWGPINGREERRRVARGRRPAVDRHPRREPGAPAVRRQPAEGHDRPLAGAAGCG